MLCIKSHMKASWYPGSRVAKTLREHEASQRLCTENLLSRLDTLLLHLSLNVLRIVVVLCQGVALSEGFN